ncbi:MAG: hypothetical protein R6V85_03055 [Polyangia bacterium]
MSPRKIPIAVIAALASASCGGAAPESVAPVEEPEPPAAVTMTEPELTSEIDPAGGLPAREVADTFDEEVGRIFLVSTLENLPVDSEIEVRWMVSRLDEPIHVSRVTASGTHRLTARLAPRESSFDPGEYRAVIYVNDEQLGEKEFRVGIAGSRWTGVRGLGISQAVTAFDNEPIKPTTSLHAGVTRVYATFRVDTDDPRPYVRVTWLRDGGVLMENDIECGKEVRCVDVYEHRKSIPEGNYEVEVEVDGDVLAGKTFHVGGKPVAPVLGFAALGPARGRKRMPRSSIGPVTLPKKKLAKGVRVGFELLTLPREAEVEVEIIAVESGETLHTSELEYSGGGDKSEVVDWKPETPLEPGRYKAVIRLGKRVMEELGFVVE